MNEEEVIEALRRDFDNNDEVDSACFTRLEQLCHEFGKDGKTAFRLLQIVRDLLSPF